MILEYMVSCCSYEATTDTKLKLRKTVEKPQNNGKLRNSYQFFSLTLIFKGVKIKNL